jgi:hypothetical protein
MENKIGRANLKGNTLYFDEVGWAMVKAVAKKLKKSPKTVVIAGLKRGMKLEKAKNA